MKNIYFLLIISLTIFQAPVFATQNNQTSTTKATTQQNRTLAGIVCKGTYALCAFAPCIPVPGSDKQALCFCSVEQGASIGQLACSDRKPTEGPYHTTRLTSNFSFQTKPRKMVECYSGRPWTQCLNMPCVVNPSNLKEAVCTCEIETTGDFYVSGEDCGIENCEKMLWSSATPSLIVQSINELSKTLEAKTQPYQICKKQNGVKHD